MKMLQKDKMVLVIPPIAPKKFRDKILRVEISAGNSSHLGVTQNMVKKWSKIPNLKFRFFSKLSIQKRFETIF